MESSCCSKYFFPCQAAINTVIIFSPPSVLFSVLLSILYKTHSHAPADRKPGRRAQHRQIIQPMICQHIQSFSFFLWSFGPFCLSKIFLICLSVMVQISCNPRPFIPHIMDDKGMMLCLPKFSPGNCPIGRRYPKQTPIEKIPIISKKVISGRKRQNSSL